MVMKQKRAKIPQKARNIIVQRSTEYPRKKRTEVALELQKELKEKGFDVPEIEVLEREISWWRNHEVDSPEDQPWSMDKLEQYPWAVKDSINLLRLVYTHSYRDKLTVREAKWACRLGIEGFIEQTTEKLSELDFQDSWDALLAFARLYSNAERVAVIQGIPFDSAEIDEILYHVMFEPLDLVTVELSDEDTDIHLTSDRNLEKVYSMSSELGEWYKKLKGVNNERSHNQEG